jgi:hypothetical protein
VIEEMVPFPDTSGALVGKSDCHQITTSIKILHSSFFIKKPNAERKLYFREFGVCLGVGVNRIYKNYPQKIQ